MSCVERDMVEGYEDIAREIQSFLWTGRPFKSERIERTKEELEAKLESIRKDCWDSYNSGANHMGWNG